MAIGILDSDSRDRRDRGLIRQLQGTERQKDTALRTLRTNLLRSQKNLTDLRSQLTRMSIPELSARGDAIVEAIGSAQTILDQLTSLDPGDPAITVLNRTIAVLSKEYNFIARRLRGSLQDYSTVNRNITQLSRTINRIQPPSVTRNGASASLSTTGTGITAGIGKLPDASGGGAFGATNNSRVRTNRVGNYVVDGPTTSANQGSTRTQQIQSTAQQRNIQNNQTQFWTAFRQDNNRNADATNKILKDILYKLDKLNGRGGGGGSGPDLPDFDDDRKKNQRGRTNRFKTGMAIKGAMAALNNAQFLDQNGNPLKDNSKNLLDLPGQAVDWLKNKAVEKSFQDIRNGIRNKIGLDDAGPAASNKGLFKPLPTIGGASADVNVGSGADVGVKNSEINLDKDTTKNFFERFFGYMSGIAVAGPPGSTTGFAGTGTGGSYSANGYGGGVGGGTNPSIGRGATRGRGSTYIPGVTPGLGQTPSQAQADAQFAREQAQMPAYNTGISGNAASGQSMQMPGGLGGTVPRSVTDLPFGSLGADSSSSALKNKNGTIVSTADTTMPAYQRALLDTISGYESSGKGQGYNTIVGGGSFDDYSKHPGVVGVTTAAGPSTAAGRYQFTKSTWNGTPGHPGIVAQFNKEHPDDPITDFSPRNQDRAAYYLAQKDYQRRTGRDLDTDLKNGDYSRIQSGLGGQGNDTTWQGFQGKQGVADAYSRNLEKNKQYADNSALSKIDASAIPNSGVGQGARASIDDITKGAQSGPSGSGMFATVPPLGVPGTAGSSAGAIGQGVIKSNGQSASQAAIDGLQPDVRARMYALGLTYRDASGNALPINSANRTREDQERLYADRANNPNPVARPGTSKHEGGRAFDIPASVADQLERDGTLDKMGLYRPHKNDPVHIEVKPDAAPLDPAMQARVDALANNAQSNPIAESTPEQKYGPGSGNPFMGKSATANQSATTKQATTDDLVNRGGTGTSQTDDLVRRPDRGNRFGTNVEGFTGQALGTQGYSAINPTGQGAFKLPDGTTINSNIAVPSAYMSDQARQQAGMSARTYRDESLNAYQSEKEYGDKITAAKNSYFQEGLPKPGEKYPDWIKRRSEMGLDTGPSQGEGEADRSAKFAFGKYNFDAERSDLAQDYQNSITPGNSQNSYANRLDGGYIGSEEQRENRQRYGNRGPDEFAPREKLSLGEIKALYGPNASPTGTSVTVTPKSDDTGADRIPYTPPAASTGDFKDDKTDSGSSSKPDTSVPGSGSAGQDSSKNDSGGDSNVSTSSIPMQHSDLGLVAINSTYLTA